jgi:hypothetical protein
MLLAGDEREMLIKPYRCIPMSNEIAQNHCQERRGSHKYFHIVEFTNSLFLRRSHLDPEKLGGSVFQVSIAVLFCNNRVKMALRGVLRHVSKSSDPLGQERGEVGKRNSLAYTFSSWYSYQ